MLALLSFALLLPQGPPGEVRSRLYVEPPAVAVGEPFELVLEVTHPLEVGVALPDAGEGETDAEALDGSWVLLESRRLASEPVPGDPGRRASRRVWRLASLEPGRRPIPPAFVAAVLPAGVDVLETAAVAVEVAGVLGPEEDEPRPLRGLPESFGARAAGEAPVSWIPWILAGAAAVLLALAFWVRRRRRARAAGRAEPVGLGERLEALAGGRPEGDGELRERHYRLSELLREAGDRELGGSNAGLTDEEWLDALERRGGLAEETRAALGEVLGRCAAVKYAGSLPSVWAFAETLGHARRALAGLEPAPVSSTAPARGQEAA